MMLVKRAIRSDAARHAFGWLGAQYISVVRATTRWQIFGSNIPRHYWDKGKPFILAFWHGRLLMMPQCWDSAIPINVLISRHRDGLLLGNIVAHFGIKTISGSSSKGGASALRAIVKNLKAGRCVAITPDGPRGPRMRVSDGIVAMAKLSGVPIIPASYSTANGRNLHSWDRFLFAFPFGNGVIVWGEPIEVPTNADTKSLKYFRQKLEDALNSVTAEADRLTGREHITPAPANPKV